MGDRGGRTEMGVLSETKTKEDRRAATSETGRYNGTDATKRTVPLARGAKSRLLGSWCHRDVMSYDGSTVPNVLARRRDVISRRPPPRRGRWMVREVRAPPDAAAAARLTLVTALACAPASSSGMIMSTLP